MTEKWIAAGVLLAFLTWMSFCLGEYWYLVWIFVLMIVIGYFRAKHMSHWDIKEDDKEKQESE